MYTQIAGFLLVSGTGVSKLSYRKPRLKHSKTGAMLPKMAARLLQMVGQPWIFHHNEACRKGQRKMMLDVVLLLSKEQDANARQRNPPPHYRMHSHCHEEAANHSQYLAVFCSGFAWV